MPFSPSAFNLPPPPSRHVVELCQKCFNIRREYLTRKVVELKGPSVFVLVSSELQLSWRDGIVTTIENRCRGERDYIFSFLFLDIKILLSPIFSLSFTIGKLITKRVRSRSYSVYVTSLIETWCGFNGCVVAFIKFTHIVSVWWFPRGGCARGNIALIASNGKMWKIHSRKHSNALFVELFETQWYERRLIFFFNTWTYIMTLTRREISFLNIINDFVNRSNFHALFLVLKILCHLE